jgi:hypothetical protein
MAVKQGGADEAPDHGRAAASLSSAMERPSCAVLDEGVGDTECCFELVFGFSQGAGVYHDNVSVLSIFPVDEGR